MIKEGLRFVLENHSLYGYGDGSWVKYQTQGFYSPDWVIWEYGISVRGQSFPALDHESHSHVRHHSIKPSFMLGWSGEQCWASEKRLGSKLWPRIQGPTWGSTDMTVGLQFLCPRWTNEFWLRISCVGLPYKGLFSVFQSKYWKHFITFKNQQKQVTQSSIN